MNKKLISVIIRTLNEAQHLEELLRGIKKQKLANNLAVEVILIDSGSTDDTVKIAKSYNCHIDYIKREDFSFGRSLNQGCELANGAYLVLVSGHCIPQHDDWLEKLCKPLISGVAEYTYGGQLGGKNTRYSEKRIFAKYFPINSKIPQEGFYCNNANSALLKSTWKHYRFNEKVTGLEDMELAKRLVNNDGKVAYIAEASVFHLHNEGWKQIKRRFEREAIALQKIMPQVHIRRRDLVRYIISSIWLDFRAAKREKVLLKYFYEIIAYRFWQYWGAYQGNHEHRELSHRQKEIYFYPN